MIKSASRRSLQTQLDLQLSANEKFWMVDARDAYPPFLFCSLISSQPKRIRNPTASAPKI